MICAIPILFLLAFPAQTEARTQARTDLAAEIAPMLGDEISIVVHFDLARLDFVETIQRISGKLADDEKFDEEIRSIGKEIDTIVRAGAKDLFLLVDPVRYREMPRFALKLKQGSDANAMSNLLTKLWARFDHEPVSIAVKGTLLTGKRSRDTRPDRSGGGSRGGELAAAFALAGNSPVTLAIVPSSIQRKALEESIESLPRELGGVPITTFTHGLKWGSLYLIGSEPSALRMLFQGKDAESAVAIAKLATCIRSLVVDGVKEVPILSTSVGMLEKLNPKVQGDRSEIEVSPEMMRDLVVPFIQSVRETRWRNRCVDRLKRIGLAMHNFHQAYGRFPLQAMASPSGKPLLSWRVQLLPFLDENELYAQFRLDEPWDSEHNKALIAKMPAVFACPTSHHLPSEGKTCYQVPHGKGTILSREYGGKLQDFTDGTTRTIMAVETGDEAAVIWTRPDDWPVDDDVRFTPLLGHHAGGTNILFADGSLRFVSDKIRQNILKALTTRDGGEVIGDNDF